MPTLSNRWNKGMTDSHSCHCPKKGLDTMITSHGRCFLVGLTDSVHVRVIWTCNWAETPNRKWIQRFMSQPSLGRLKSSKVTLRQDQKPAFSDSFRSVSQHTTWMTCKSRISGMLQLWSRTQASPTYWAATVPASALQGRFNVQTTNQTEQRQTCCATKRIRKEKSGGNH